VAAAVGWLYLLRGVAALDIGPSVSGALPLEQLAGGDDQPLARLVAVWLPCGWLAGEGLVGLGVAAGGRVGRALRVGLVALVVLVVAGAVSDAAAISDPIASHLSAQAGRAGSWVAVAITAAGALGASGRRRGGRPAPTAQ